MLSFFFETLSSWGDRELIQDYLKENKNKSTPIVTFHLEKVVFLMLDPILIKLIKGNKYVLGRHCYVKLFKVFYKLSTNLISYMDVPSVVFLKNYWKAISGTKC